MAEKKRNINPEQFNEFLTYVATKVEPTQIEDIFTGKAFKETIDMFKEDNPLIKSYQLTGAGFINKLLKDKTDFNLTNDDKKLIIEVGAFGNPDPRSGFKLNMSDPKIQDKVEKMSEDLVKQKQNLSNDEYEIYRANARKKLVNDVLKFKVTDTVFDNEAPKLDVSERDRSKPFSDFITKELNMQSRYGFNPKIPDFAGGTVGKEYIPANDQERYRTKTITSEYFPDETTTRDRLENFYPDKESGYLRGPEGLFYNPEAEKFLRQKDVYGPTPQLQGYQYDPRLKGILSTAVNPNYGSQFKEGGKTMDIKQQTKNVAAQGRYGDSMLLHVNPAEVKGLASAMPITVNPETGQPEAFLPFLAPLLGSVFGPTLFASLGATGALTGLAGSALGSGLAQYAATGDLKKGLLAGLTGYGVGTALQGAAGAAGASAASQAATDVATTAGTLGEAATQEAIQSAATQAGGEALKTASTFAPATATTAVTGTPLANLKSVFNPAAITDTTAAAAPDLLTSSVGTTVNPTLGTSFGNLATGLTDPMAYIPAGIGMGGTGIMESQEAFERMIGESEEEYRRRREAMYRNNPEPILYSAEGGRTGYYEGGRFGEIPDYIGGDLPQIYAPARQPYQVNPNFMAGFSPETMYFEPSTISAPASGLQAGAPSVAVDTYEGSKGGYGGRQAYIAPQVSIDPYTAYTGEAPEGLKFGKQPRPVFEGPELPDQGLVNPGLPDFGTGPVGLGGRIGIPNIGNLDIQSIIDSLDQYNIPEREIGTGEFMNQQITPPSTLGELLPLGVDNQIDISQYLGSREDNLEALQSMFGPQVEYATGLEPNTDSGMGLGLGEMMTAEELIARGGTPQPRGLGIFGKGPINTPRLGNDSGFSTPTEQFFDKARQAPVATNTDYTSRAREYYSQGMATPEDVEYLATTPTQMITGDFLSSVLPTSAKAKAFLAGKPEALIDRNNLIEYMKNQGLEPDFASGGDTGLGRTPVLPNFIMPTTAPVSPVAMPMPVDIMRMPVSSNPNFDVSNLGQFNFGNRQASDFSFAGGFTPASTPAIAPASNYVSGFGFGGRNAEIPVPDISQNNLQQQIDSYTQIMQEADGIKQNLEDLKESEPDFAGGGKTLPNKGLKALNEVAPKVVENMGYQEGGMTEIMNDPLTQEVTMFILGETDNEQALNDFITKYGSDAFMQLREAVLQSIVPNAQTQGLIRGDGEGGMDDDLRGMIGDKERIAVSQDEFIVPADVVSMLGDGSSDAGSKELYDMMDRVRKEKTGTTKQAPRLANAGGLLPA